MADDPTTGGDDGLPERPASHWTQRAEQAKRDGTWYHEGEQAEPLEMSAGARWRRFLSGFGVTLALAVIARMVLTAVTGRANHLDPGFVLDALLGGVFFAVLVGLYFAFGFRRRPSSSAADSAPER